MESDFLFSLFSSSVFWFTVFGISFRAFKVDREKLENRLKSIFNSIDHVKIPVLRIFFFITDRFISSVYGQNKYKKTIVVFLSVFVVSAFILFNLKREWDRNKIEIENSIKEAIARVDYEYYSIVYSPDGYKKVGKAFEEVETRFSSYYTHNDTASRKIREIGKRFFNKFKNYVVDNELQRPFFIECHYSRSFSNPHTIGESKANLYALVILTVIAAVMIDLVALRLTLKLYSKLKDRSKQSIYYIFYLIFLFFLGELNMSSLTNGNGLAALNIFLFLFTLIVYISTGALLYGIYRLATAKKDALNYIGSGLLFVVSGIIGSGGLTEAYILPLNMLHELTLTTRTFFGNFSREGLLLGLTSLFPLFLIVSLFLISALFKYVYSLLKTYILGQIYGATILSGGTFLAGFMTVIITTTTILYVLIKFFSRS